MKRRGFTLLELMVVLALLAITAVAAVPAYLSTSFATPEQKIASTLAAILSEARSAARESGSAATVVISPTDGRIWFSTGGSTTSRVLARPRTVSLIAPTADRIECRFNATGSATPLAITVHGANDITVRVDGWSGDITIGDRHVP